MDESIKDEMLDTEDKEFMKMAALGYYSQGKMTFEEAADYAGVSYDEFADFLGEYGIG